MTASILGFALLASVGRHTGRRYCPLEEQHYPVDRGGGRGHAGHHGSAGAIPALQLLGHRYIAVSLVIWGLLLGVLGVLVSFAVRGRFIVERALAFPTAVATAR